VQGLGKDEKNLLVYGGWSAGSRGAMVSLDYYHDKLKKDGVQVVGYLDSPYWIDQKPFANVTSLADQMQLAVNN